MTPGPRNLITDVPGILVGNAQDHRLKSGVTVVTGQDRMTAAVHVMGGAPGSRETDLLAPENVVEQVDALVLSGGSALGLDAATGVSNALRAAGRGFPIQGITVPIVPAAILMDLLNGGDKDWDVNPYPALGARALAAAGPTFDLGTAGAGTGATCLDLKGGLGSASLVLGNGITVGAVLALNPLGSPVMGDGPEFWAAPFEIGSEFGGLGIGHGYDPQRPVRSKIDPRGNTAIAVVATDAALTGAQAKRMAIAAHDGIARAVVPSHTPFDGDLIFAAATGARPLDDPGSDTLRVGHAAAICVTRAAARAVYLASAADNDTVPTWQDRFGPG